MDDKVNSVRGGVSILHKLEQGKNHYEVAHVVKYKRGNAAGPFLRKGDKLLKINGENLENLSPEIFAEMLTKGSPMLTVHQPSRNKCEEQKGLYPFQKERIVMQLSPVMRREEELEEERQQNRGEDGRGHPNDGKEPLDGGCQSHDGELDGLLLVYMTKTSMSIVRGRGCDDGSPCHNCGGEDCRFNDVVMAAESTKLTLVSKGINNFLREKVQDDVLIRSIVHDMCINNRNRAATMSMHCCSNAGMSIYHYRSDCVDDVGREYPGAPVVLNFTGTESFLKCSDHGGKARLDIESCEKSKLMHITQGNKETWPFVFYMKIYRDHSRRFESANCPGWCIQSMNENVAMEHIQREDEMFLFVIQKRPNQ
ncbi:hypothetical protein GJAV_G00107200 [Gymnothorax javanicus]|nr:hypothetical protein GJAV_G00107200 [Gymnothorax javanicus]